MKILILFLLFSLTTYASTEELALSMIPRGKVIEHFGKDFIIKTTAGTKIHVEFKRDGKFQEASGRNLNQGDELEPGDGLISLSTVAQNISKLGLRPGGIWNLEEDKEHGWVYEFNGNLISAKTGKLIGTLSVNDSLPAPVSQ